MSRSHWSARRPRTDWDVVVVGAGIVGASIALWLRRTAPALNVLLVERDTPGAGASGRNAGFVIQGSATCYAEDVDRLGREAARDLWKLTLETRTGLLEVAGDGCDARTDGSYIAAGSTEELARLERSSMLLAEDGFDSDLVDADELRIRMGAEGFSGALFLPTGMTVDPLKLVQAIVRASSAELWPYCPVLAVRWKDHEWSLDTACGNIRAAQVVLATNAYLSELMPSAASLVRPVRAQMLSALAGTFRLPAPVYSHDGYYYVRSSPDGHLLVGGARHLHLAEEVGFRDSTTPALQDDLRAYVRTHFPAARTFDVQERWSGTMGYTERRLPLVADLFSEAGARGGLVAAGFSGHGMSMGFGVARYVADRINGRSDPAFDELFRPEYPLAAGASGSV